MNSVDSEINKKFPDGCFLPLNAIALHPQGYPHFCLTSTLPSTGGLKDLSEARMQIHEQLMRGEWPESCLRCRNKEKRNLQSRRTRTWERKTTMYGREKLNSLLKSQSEPTIRHLEISFSNVCNIACAMCSSEFSTSWIKHDEMAVKENLSFREFTTPFRRVARVSKELLAEIFEHVNDFDLIIVKGGEPTREPLCLEFLHKVSEKFSGKKGPSVFIQSNGTRPPEEWIYQLKNLHLEVGFSFDGWGKTFNWIRGAEFEKVLNHFHAVSKIDFVKSMSIDFTLSAYNCFHLPDFFERVIELKSQIPKLKECPVFQWVQQPYASPLNLKLEDRLRMADLCEPIFKKEPKLFLNYENLLKILRHPRANEESIKQAKDWFEYLNRIRGFHLESDSIIRESLN